MCEEFDCPVHKRFDKIERNDADEFFSGITYVNQWAVFSSDNAYMVEALLAGKGFIPFMVLVIKVDDKSLGDFLTPEEINSRIYEYSSYNKLDDVENAHHMIVSGLRSGLLNPSKPISVQEVIEAMR